MVCPQGSSLLGIEMTTFQVGIFQVAGVLVRGRTALSRGASPSPRATEHIEVYLSCTQGTVPRSAAGSGCTPHSHSGTWVPSMSYPILARSYLSSTWLELGHCQVWVPSHGKRKENVEEAVLAT